MNNKLTAKERAHLARVKQIPWPAFNAPPGSEGPHIQPGLQLKVVSLCPYCHRNPVLGLHGPLRAWSVRKMDELKALDITIRRLLSA